MSALTHTAYAHIYLSLSSNDLETINLTVTLVIRAVNATGLSQSVHTACLLVFSFTKNKQKHGLQRLCKILISSWCHSHKLHASCLGSYN